MVVTLSAGGTVARQSILCNEKPESWGTDIDGNQALTQSCLNSLGVDGGTINLNNG